MSTGHRRVSLSKLFVLLATTAHADGFAARDGEMNAFMQLPGSRTASKRGVFYNMTASSLQDDSGIPMNRHEAPTSSGSTEATVRVPTLDFARWLSSNFCSRDHVHVKMDIEGAEFQLLEHLLANGAAPIIDELSVEWHTANVGPRLKRRRKQQKSRLERQLRKEGVKVEDWSV